MADERQRNLGRAARRRETESERIARLDVERRRREQDDRSWVTLTMEAPIWMLWTVIAVAVATMVVLYLGGVA